MKQIIIAVLLLLALCPLAAEADETGRLYLDESYLNKMTGELHIVISLAAAAQFMADLAEGKVLVNYIDLPGPKGGSSGGSGRDRGKAASEKKNPAIPDIQELTGYTREELEALYKLAGPEQVDSMMGEQGMPGFGDVLKAYDILSGEAGADSSEDDEDVDVSEDDAKEEDERDITPSGAGSIVRSR